MAAASELGIGPRFCVVFEDAISGVQAAKCGGMFCVGIVRIGTSDDLADAGADIVVADLDEVSYSSLKQKLIRAASKPC